MKIDEVENYELREWLRRAERRAAEGYRATADPVGDAETADRHVLEALNHLYSADKARIADARRSLIAAHGALHRMATVDRVAADRS